MIGILAAITIVAFNGVQSRAQASRVQSDVANAGKMIEVYKSSGSTSQYPATMAEAGITEATGMTYSTGVDGSYCLTKIVGVAASSISSNQPSSASGFCGGDSVINRYLLNGDVGDSAKVASNGAASGISYQAGQNALANNAASFTATSYVQLPAATLTPRPLTISAWVYPTSYGSGEGIFVVAADPGARISITTGGLIYCTVSVNGAWYADSWYSGAGSASVALNTWSHLTLTVSENQMKSYVNGAPAKIATLPSTGVVSYNSATPYVIGSDNYSGAAYHNNMVGRIDDVSFFKRVLSDAEIKNLYLLGAQ